MESLWVKKKIFQNTSIVQLTFPFICGHKKISSNMKIQVLTVRGLRAGVKDSYSQRLKQKHFTDFQHLQYGLRQGLNTEKLRHLEVMMTRRLTMEVKERNSWSTSELDGNLSVRCNNVSHGVTLL